MNTIRSIMSKWTEVNVENICQNEASEYAKVVENIRTWAESLTASQENKEILEENILNIADHILEIALQYHAQRQDIQRRDIHNLQCAEEDIEQGRITEDRKDQHWQEKKAQFRPEKVRVARKLLEEIVPLIAQHNI